ncbi:MAG: hypothetical protein U9R25_17120, partial [Chloroflexota bacterium]|nr:hypothetical protein [Chloroflexota bacterium]
MQDSVDRQPELADLILGVLRSTLFSGRAFIRPSDLKRLADSETESYLAFFADGNREAVAEHGGELCRSGVGDEAILQLGEVLRQHVSYDQDLIAMPDLRMAETYHRALLQGYLIAQRDIILEEQERIRFALQQTLHRYTIQVQTASEVAQATISTL